MEAKTRNLKASPVNGTYASVRPAAAARCGLHTPLAVPLGFWVAGPAGDQ